MNKIKQTLFWCIAFTVFSVFQFSPTFAQENITVKGKVVDDSNEPLIGVSVGINGAKGGTRTDVNGDFQISVPATTRTLKFSYIGFDNKTVAVTANMKVALKSATNTLEDVVVTGYQTVKKKDLTGAVSNITSKDFNQGNVTSSILQIQGKVAGLVIVQSSGNPNDAPTIRLRGQTSLYGDQNPLIVVDGVQLNGAADLALIPPGDIATYDVLKDASATSIYGSRGANGVIIVTTKKGASGQARVDYQGFAAIDNQAKYADLLDGDQWRAANPAYTARPEFSSTAKTNWQKEITRQAYTQSHTVSVSGGSKGFTYRGSANYINQDNIVPNSGRQQMGIRFNAEQKALNNKLELQLGIANSITNQKNQTPYWPFINNASPALAIYNEDGGYNLFNLQNGQLRNEVQKQNQIRNEERRNYTQYSGSAKYTIFTGLKAGVMGTYTTNTNNTDYWSPQYDLSKTKEEFPNFARKTNATTDNYRGEVNLSYDKSIGKHNFNVFSVYEYQYFTNNSFRAEATNIFSPFFQENDLSNSDRINRDQTSFRAENKLISLLGRLNYNYDNKYYATLSLRRDGSTKFGVNNRWGTFPAANVAWRITQESFMKDILWVNDLKLRAGYGQTGNQDALTEYNSLLLRTSSFDGLRVNYAIDQNPNPNLQWEVRKGRNIGLDFALFNSRLSGDINYFNDITNRLLFNYEDFDALPIPATGGKPTGKYILANVGSLTNKGLELALNFRAVEKKDFQWTVGGQISGVRTKIKTLEDASGTLSKSSKIVSGRHYYGGSFDLTYLQAGYTPFVFQLPRYLGLDADGKQLVSADSTYIDPSPRFNYGISNSFTYKNFNLSFFVRGVSGVKIYNATANDLESGIPIRLASGFNTTNAGLEGNIQDGVKPSDKWIENASFLRMDNASLGYTFKQFKGIKNLKIYVAANNIFVITKFKGLDPETGVSGRINQDNPTNYNYINVEEQTPRTRSYSFGINASF
ncbi:MAG: SusC/RagA family TonB-linked outer membrane protein [Sphingobacteriales bacterium]|nr:MAG: SusC/RagA family TonB-linked outer membrane protein [Sphingobacteriales bacterium]